MEIAWSGDDWQAHCELLFREHHGAGNYQSVPDTDSGDLGLEGFSVDEKSHCYQCFATEKTEVRARFEAQRDKMSTDLRKLIRNKDRVRELLGEQKLRRWVFMVPIHDSKRLVAHARKKEAELLNAELDLLAEDFKVVIHTEGDYKREIAVIEAHGIATIGALGEDVGHAAVKRLEEDEPEQVRTLDQKLGKVVGDPSSLRSQMLRFAVDGANIREHLHREHPLTAEQITEQVAIERRAVVLERDLDELHKGSLRTVQGRLADRLIKHAPALREDDSNRLSYGVVASWLMECPIDFPEGANGG